MALAKSQKSLKSWTKQKWRTKSGKPSAKTGERYLPSKAIESLSPSEYAATTRAKRKGTKAGKQHVAQPKKVAEKTKRYRRTQLLTLISHFPLPSMPFQTHENIVFEKADKDRSARNNEEYKPEQPNKVTPDTPVEDLKLVNQMYAYNPNPNKLRTPDGQIVDFIIA